jgi:ubiquinone/menaquinone biosynthesis C-methylase UbiE
MTPEISWWETAVAAKNYINDKPLLELLLPGRQATANIVIQLATQENIEAKNILDIGCGNGDITSAILKERPNSSFYLVDISKDLIEACKLRFENHKNIHYFIFDLNNGLPEQLNGIPFDIIVSCFSLHHLITNRGTLYNALYQGLKTAGLFINGDTIQEDNKSLNEWSLNQAARMISTKYQQTFGKEHSIDEIRQIRKHSSEETGDNPITVFDDYSQLKNSGFNTIDCIFKSFSYAVLVSSK